jgi:hypothetical protein
MALAVTASFSQLTIEIETSTPGTYAKICGMKDFTIKGTQQVDSDEIPDCADESLPYAMTKDVRAVEVTISGTMTWAQSSHDVILKWNRLGETKNVRVTYGNASVGDVYTETGPALLTSLTTQRSKGKSVSSEVEIQFKGVPTMVDRVS